MQPYEARSQERGRHSTTPMQDGQISRQQSGVEPQVPQASQARRNWPVMAIAAIGVFMATLDSSIVNISLPTIARYFGVPLNGTIEWVVIAYLVTTASILLTAGRLADMIGRKAVWLAGLIIFTGGSALCGAAPSLTFLVIARALQGLGGALLMSISPALVTGAFPPHERGRALGLNAINVALGISVGPTLGGFITAYWSWRWIFYVNVPIGIIGIIATMRILKEPARRLPARFDPLGAAMLGIGMALLTAGLSFGQEMGWNSPLILSGLIGGTLLLILLPLAEARVANPIIVLSLLRDRVFSSSVLSLLLSFLALFAVAFMMPFYLEELRLFSTETAGLLLTAQPITIAAIAPISGSLADRFGSRWLAASGLTIACVGLVLISQLNAQSSIFDIVWRLVFTSVGQAIFQSPNNSAMMGAAPREHQGSASGFMATARTMGQSLSIAVAGAIFTSLGGAAAGLTLVTTRPGGSQLAALQQTFISSFQITFLVCAAIAAVGIFASLVRGKEGRRRI